MLVTGYVLTAIIALGISYIGVNYLFAPAKIAVGFGFAHVPDDAENFLNVKGGRDVGAGLVLLALTIYGDPHALGWVMLTAAVWPLFDMLIILRHHGKKAIAFSVHGLTALVTVVAAGLLLLG
ncbi:DUF4267 domain-containing protein [Amycolatopsis sp. SID8362]|uniref:DUF4267 domain-containing protein n=1 Tax=Amycolatopsis sp. SID8362 TaxID=2690346 RepID=UPI00136EBE68|nr:DUF4267 domain-containing protein [Amycolatopsis sp. SID8362]NBH04766.1 DUF4267 domain-containing protein [Amycolatopsis sp. SID8362]NED41466.1 DUF4267 domain-containing protein [Amycolatopsis sp. SID8362]